MISFLLLALSSSALAGAPMAPRTVTNPYVKNEELAMAEPPNGCGPDTGCVTVLNTGGTYLKVENSTVPGTMRVTDGDGYILGVYMDTFPTLVTCGVDPETKLVNVLCGVDPTTGRRIPLLDGAFVSVMDPCLRSGFNARTHLKVGAASTVNLSATQIVFYAEPGDVTVAIDYRTGAVIKYHPGYGELGASGGVIRNTLRSGPGTSDIGWTARLGNGKCRDRS